MYSSVPKKMTVLFMSTMTRYIPSVGIFRTAMIFIDLTDVTVGYFSIRKSNCRISLPTAYLAWFENFSICLFFSLSFSSNTMNVHKQGSNSRFGHLVCRGLSGHTCLRVYANSIPTAARTTPLPVYIH